MTVPHRLAVVAALLLLTGCSGGPSSSPSTAPDDEGTPVAVTSAPEGTPIAPTSGSLAPEAAGLAGMTLLTPTSGGGERPVLAWSPVDGARSYTIVVSTPDGAAYWAWQGRETSVPLGGVPALEPHAAGPRLVPGMSWVVAAHDDDHHVVAVSNREPLGP